MTENYGTRPHVTGNDLDLTSFHLKSPGSCVEVLKVKVWVLLNSYRAVTRKRWRYLTGNDVT